MSLSWTLFLQDIEEAATKIQRYTKGLDLETFVEHEMAYDAVLRNLEIIGEAELPTSILPVEGFPKLPEFWGTMGVNHRWKPAVYLVVTLPVVLPTEVAGPMVTTRISEYRQTGRPETAGCGRDRTRRSGPGMTSDAASRVTPSRAS